LAIPSVKVETPEHERRVGFVVAANVTSGDGQRRNNGDKVAAMVTAGRVALGVIVAGVGWLGLYRPWHLRWGATPEEVARRLPGDDVLPAPTFNATRAVTVHTPPEAIWPWIGRSSTASTLVARAAQRRPDQPRT
jgi:hypothetical protein